MAWWHRKGQKVVCVKPMSGVAFELIEVPRGWLFGAHRFRPVVNRSSETGVAALRRHLIGAPVKEGA